MLDYRSKALVDANGFLFREMFHRQPFEMACHAHEEAHFALILSGQVQNRSGQRSAAVGPSTFSYTPSECEHRTMYRNPVRAFYIAVRKDVTDRLGSAIACNLGSSREFLVGPELDLAKRLYEEYRLREGTSSLMMEGLMLELFATMARAKASAEFVKPPKWLIQAQEMLHAEIGDPFSISQVADAVAVHPVHLMRTFRRYFGKPIGAYVRDLRIELACRRLKTLEPERTLGQLALELGFSGPHQFSRAFRQAVGCSPSQYQRSVRSR